MDRWYESQAQLAAHYLTWCDCLVLKDWERLWLRKDEKESVERSLIALLFVKGGSTWIDSHPWLLKDQPQPLHAASFRTTDLIRDRQVLAFEFEGRTVFFLPEDARLLLASL